MRVRTILLVGAIVAAPSIAFAQFSGLFRANLSAPPAASLTAQHVLGYGVVDNNTGSATARQVLGFGVVRIE